MELWVEMPKRMNDGCGLQSVKHSCFCFITRCTANTMPIQSRRSDTRTQYIPMFCKKCKSFICLGLSDVVFSYTSIHNRYTHQLDALEKATYPMNRKTLALSCCPRSCAIPQDPDCGYGDRSTEMLSSVVLQ